MTNKLKRDAMFEQLVSPLNLEKNSNNASAGFSLVEALIAMFILGIIGLGISRMSKLGFKSAASKGSPESGKSCAGAGRHLLLHAQMAG